MPNCFSLTRKGDTKAEKFIDIDARMCEELGVSCDPEKWYESWYDCLGFALACGKTFTQIRESYIAGVDNMRQRRAGNGPPAPPHAEVVLDAEWLRVLCWLEHNYTCDAWAEVGRR